jgi:hypothetical protein
MPPASAAIPDIAIRPYAPEDFERVAALMIELQEFERGITRIACPPIASSRPWYIARLLRGLDETGGTLLVAIDGGTPSGYAAGYQRKSRRCATASSTSPSSSSPRAIAAAASVRG